MKFTDHLLFFMDLSRFRYSASFGVVVVGVVLEHLDQMLVNLYSTSMTSHFVWSGDRQLHLILGFVGYGISFLFRPAGAAIFGLMSDWIGRKASMLLSLTLMSLSTLGLGMIPSYERIGFLATGLFVLCRIVQGMSIGGEYGTALTYAYEASGVYRTFAGALVISATHIGGLVAAILASHFHSNFQGIFQIVGIVGLLSLGLRSILVENYQPPKNRQGLFAVFKASLDHFPAYRRSFMIASALVFTFYSTLVYLNEVIFQAQLAPRQEIFYSNILLLGLWVVIPPVLGYWVDRNRFMYRKVMVFGSLGVGLLAWPVLQMACHVGTFQSMVTAQILISLMHMVYCFGTPRYFGDQFGSDIRGTGVALSYSLGASFTAAVTPLICHGISTFFGSVEFVAVPMSFFSLLAFFHLIDGKRSLLARAPV